MHRAAWAFLVMAACTPSTTSAPTPPPAGAPSQAASAPVPERATQARVTRVVDGDTVVLDGIDHGKRDSSTSGRHARLVGVDTPEVYGELECYGREASAFTKRELTGVTVWVDFDVEATDRYDRALVYLWHLDGRFFNGRLAAEGYANQLTIPPNVRYAELFTDLVREAREHDRGLWAGCTEVEPPVSSVGDCHPSYPDVCIPPSPPNLDCRDVSHRGFRVRHDVADPDPHHFDGNGDGVGCER